MNPSDFKLFGVALVAVSFLGACTVKRDAPLVSDNTEMSHGDFILQYLDFGDLANGGTLKVHEFSDEDRDVLPATDPDNPPQVNIPKWDESDGSTLITVFLAMYLRAHPRHTIRNTGGSINYFRMLNGALQGFVLHNGTQIIPLGQDELVLETIARLRNGANGGDNLLDTDIITMENTALGLDGNGNILEEYYFEVPSGLLHLFRASSPGEEIDVNYFVNSGRTSGECWGANCEMSSYYRTGWKFTTQYVVNHPDEG